LSGGSIRNKQGKSRSKDLHCFSPLLARRMFYLVGLVCNGPEGTLVPVIGMQKSYVLKSPAGRQPLACRSVVKMTWLLSFFSKGYLDLCQYRARIFSI
jgi:hypothetical protein